MKKTIVILLAVMLIFTQLAACGQKEPPGSVSLPENIDKLTVSWNGSSRTTFSYTDPAKIKSVAEYLSSLVLETTKEDPTLYAGGGWVITVFSGDETLEMNHYGNMFFQTADKKWWEISYDQAAELDELVKKMLPDEMPEFIPQTSFFDEWRKAAENDDAEIPAMQPMQIRDIVPSLKDPTEIAVKAPGSPLSFFIDEDAPAAFFAPADAAQRQMVIDCLAPLAAAQFTEVEGYGGEGTSFTTSPILIRNGSDECEFSVATQEEDGGKVYITVIPLQTPADVMAGEEVLPIRCYEGASEAFHIRELNDALTEILSDTSDVQNVAAVQVLDSDKPETIVNKMVTAVWRYVLDASSKNNGEIEEPEGQNYDARITIGEKTYLLNVTSGVFTAESGEDTITSLMNEQTLSWFLQTYGFYLS